MFPVDRDLTDVIVDQLELPYPIYADPDYSLFAEYQTRFSAGPPLPAWIVIDADGVIRYVWRATEGGLRDEYPEGDAIVAVIEALR